MKFPILALLLLVSALACATIYPLPAFVNRTYHPCENDETPDPAGKLCYTRCIDRSFFTKKCKEWEVDVKDFSDPMTFARFRAGGFKMAVGI